MPTDPNPISLAVGGVGLIFLLAYAGWLTWRAFR